MSRLLALGGSACALSFALLVACVGDDPQVGNPEVDAGQQVGSSSGAPDGSGGSSGTPMCKGDTVEACGASCTKCATPTGGTVACVNGACEKTCPGGQTLCGDACIDTTTSAAHCGKCDHACGAGQCSAGACQPFVAATGFTNVHAIAMSPSGVIIAADSDVSLCDNPAGCTAASLKTIRAGVSQLHDVTVAGTNVYFDGNEGDFEVVYRCPVAGCPGTGADVIENVANDTIGRVVAGPSSVLWTRSNSFYGPYSRRCSLPACSPNADVRPRPTTGPYTDNPAREQTRPSEIVSVGAASVLWATGSLYNDNYKQLRACGLGAACPTPTEIDTGAAPVSALTYHDGKHYGVAGAASGSVIFSVSDAALGARTLLVSDAAGVTDVAVDASGMYWVNGTTGKVLRCATLTGCMGSGETLATGQTGARHIRLDAKFVYWTTATTVLKVAK